MEIRKKEAVIRIRLTADTPVLGEKSAFFYPKTLPISQISQKSCE